MRQKLNERWGRRATNIALAGVAAGALSACDSLLEVDLPHLLRDDAIKAVATAELQVNSAIALFECGYAHFGLTTLGHDDAMTSVAGSGGGNNVFGTTASTGACDSSDNSIAWFDQIMGSRSMLTTAPARLHSTSQGTVTSSFPFGRGVYDRIQDEWGIATVPANGGQRLSAIAAIYVAMSLTHMGEFMCDMSLDGSDLLTPPEVLAIADTWITRARTHITAGGDFTMPFGIAGATGSAGEMATAVRARLLWASGDLAGAATEAGSVLTAEPRFTAWVMRDVGTTRRNKIWFTNTFQPYSGMMRLNTNWGGPTRAPNPATGTTWPAILGHTGYIGLGISPDGRTLVVNPANNQPNIPVRFADEVRNTAGAQVPCSGTSSLGCITGAVQDLRVTHMTRPIQGTLFEVPTRYGTTAAGADGQDIPYMTWEELKLIQAEYQNSDLNNQAAAVALINEIRADPSDTGTQTIASLPSISGAYLTELTDGAPGAGGVTDQQAVRAVILEERRREFFSEAGRYFSSKIQNPDVLWFPRRQGTGLVYVYQGGVRFLMPTDEYTTNPHFVDRGRESARGTGCANEGPLPGSVVPVF